MLISASQQCCWYLLVSYLVKYLLLVKSELLSWNYICICFCELLILLIWTTIVIIELADYYRLKVACVLAIFKVLTQVSLDQST